MSKATYRGVSYDTAEPKKQFISWHKDVDCKDHVYRGQHYFPIQTMDEETKKEIYNV